MRFAVLADTHIGRSIPIAIAEHRREAFSAAFTQAVNTIIEMGVDYTFICGDLFERRTLRPHLVQFAHDELYRLARETEERHRKRVKILVIRGNHDGRPQSDTLDYIKHPLADYLHIFEEDDLTYKDERLHVVGLNYYDQIDRAFEVKAKPAFNDAQGMRVFMLHGFISGYNDVPPYNSSLTLDQLVEVVPNFVFTGHYHRRCSPQKLPNGGWIITPGSLEMYDFGEQEEKGFYVVDTGVGKPKFTWVAIEPKHIMKQVTVDPRRRRSPTWFSKRIEEHVRSFSKDLENLRKPGYLRIRLRGGLSEGFPSEINLTIIDGIVESEDHLLWVDVDTMNLELPPSMVRLERENLDVAEFFSELGDFADDIRGMHFKVAEVLEEEASLQTGLLTPSRRIPLVEEWVKLLEGRSFRGEDA